LSQIHTEDVFVPRTDEFKGYSQRSKVNVTKDKNGIFGPFGGLRAVYVYQNMFSF